MSTMAFIKAATFAATSLLTALRRNVGQFRSITLLSSRTIYTGAGEDYPDAKFLGSFRGVSCGLSVTDLIDSDWCEKQKEFSLTTMNIDNDLHSPCEVIKKARYQTQSAEDVWAIKLMYFIIRTNELLVRGLTCELPVVSFTHDEWMVGRIDELRMPPSNSENLPMIVERKTRRRATLPREPQIRKGRFQVMCYKKFWDSLVSDEFPADEFYDHFSLNPAHSLSPDIVKKTARSSFPCKTLHDVVEYFRATCYLLPPAHDHLLLRYELEGNQELLREDRFPYDPDWVTAKIEYHLEFLLGKREASCTPEEERWKCRFCPFSSECPANSSSKQT